MPFDEPIWRDGDPSKSVTAQALTQLGKQYATAIADVTAGIADPEDPIGAAVRIAAAETVSAGGLVEDPADPGFFTTAGGITPDPSDEGFFLTGGI